MGERQSLEGNKISSKHRESCRGFSKGSEPGVPMPCASRERDRLGSRSINWRNWPCRGTSWSAQMESCVVWLGRPFDAKPVSRWWRCRHAADRRGNIRVAVVGMRRRRDNADLGRHPDRAVYASEMARMKRIASHRFASSYRPLPRRCASSSCGSW